MFFDDYPEFLETSETATGKARLNARHRVMINANRDLLTGARVLDIASHDGRWSFAALKAGAEHVTGVEGRADLVDKANATFKSNGIEPQRYDFIHGDAHDVLSAEAPAVDVVLCLGFLYHTLRYPELLSGIRSTGAPHLIVDTRVLPKSTRPIVKIEIDPSAPQSMAVADRFSNSGSTLTGVPSVPALERMLAAYDYFVVSRPDWRSIVRRRRRKAGLRSYADGERVTFVAELRPPALDQPGQPRPPT
jgi:hypothetical protein